MEKGGTGKTQTLEGSIQKLETDILGGIWRHSPSIQRCIYKSKFCLELNLTRDVKSNKKNFVQK